MLACVRGCLLVSVLLLSACAGGASAPGKSANRVYLNEAFASTETFSRVFASTVTGTCESARRALLSQGYVITTARPDAVNGRKSFQPEAEVHVQIEFHIVCVPEVTAASAAPTDPPSTIAFVNAVQDRYSLKKNPNSASLGVSAIGSLSLPVSSSDDSLVKVASETIPAGAFYDRFFSLIERYLDAP